MDEFPNTNGYSFSWTQPYNVSMNPFYSAPGVETEMARLEQVDRWVDAMFAYPDAEEVLNKTRRQT